MINKSNPTPGTLQIPAGNLQPRNLDSVVKISVDGGFVVGTLESYSVMPDGASMNLKLRGCEAVDISSRTTIELSRTSDYNARTAQSMTVQELLSSILNSTNKTLALADDTSNAIHDIADLLETPDSPAQLIPVTPLALAAA